MNDFEKWYRSVRSGPNGKIDVSDDLKKDYNGEYHYQETYWMFKAYCAGSKGLVIAQIKNRVRICTDYDSKWYAFQVSNSGPKFDTELEAIEWAEQNGYHVQ